MKFTNQFKALIVLLAVFTALDEGVDLIRRPFMIIAAIVIWFGGWVMEETAEGVKRWLDLL